jgi:acetyltransferase-like isoleucine patch superfamily enzyme
MPASTWQQRLARERSRLRGPLSAHQLLRRLAARGYARLARMELPEVGPGVTFSPSAVVIGTGNVHIGADSNINWHVRLNTTGDGVLRVGSRVWIGPHCVLSASRAPLTVGDDVLFAGNCFVSTARHAFEGEGPVRFQGSAGHAPVTIEDGAWLASNVVVLPGVTVGGGAVVGANSVVTEDVPPRSVVVGAPARVVRSF